MGWMRVQLRGIAVVKLERQEPRIDCVLRGSVPGAWSPHL